MRHRIILFLVAVSLIPLTIFAPRTAAAESTGAIWDDYVFENNERLIIRMFAPDAVRTPADLTASLELNYSGEKHVPVQVLGVRIEVNGSLVHLENSFALYGDGGWYRSFIRTLERMHPTLSGLYMHRLFTPRERALDSPGAGDYGLFAAALEMVERAREDTYFRDFPTVLPVDFSIPLSDLDERGEFHIGEKITVTALISFTEGEKTRRVKYVHTIDVVEPFPQSPVRYYDGYGVLREIPGNWHSGDLHVHYCKDEASFFGERGCPDCQAESVNFGDDNTLADLKGQYQALGASWFTITSHSYCIESVSEYEQVRFQAEAVSDGSFLVIPDTELSSEEEGPQTGGDLGDVICPNGSNHSGAHFIRSHKPGGLDGFLEVCEGPVYSFLDNIAAIRAEGGFGIVNHPSAPTWGWNSVALLPDRDSDGFHGIEIWNGPDGGGQGGHVGFWVDRLLEGKKFYAYSGSDTHDDAFDFGWNHALILGQFTSAKLKTALRRGRLYVSNYQQLATVVYRQGVGLALMGGKLNVPSHIESVRLFILCNMGTKTGSVTVFSGSVGHTDEEVVFSLNNISGNNIIPVDVSTITGEFYLRVYSEVTGEPLYAYSNPVWVERLDE